MEVNEHERLHNKDQYQFFTQQGPVPVFYTTRTSTSFLHNKDQYQFFTQQGPVPVFLHNKDQYQVFCIAVLHFTITLDSSTMRITNNLK
jgi:hypothetical protein